MTYDRLMEEMTSDEFELRLALESIRADECPHCGVEPRDLMKFHHVTVKCPVCRNEYGKTRPTMGATVLRTGGNFKIAEG